MLEQVGSVVEDSANNFAIIESEGEDCTVCICIKNKRINSHYPIIILYSVQYNIRVMTTQYASQGMTIVQYVIQVMTMPLTRVVHRTTESAPSICTRKGNHKSITRSLVVPLFNYINYIFKMK